MYDKQEMFEAFRKYCAIPDEDSPMAEWVTDMQIRGLATAFDFYYNFLKDYMQQHDPDSL